MTKKTNARRVSEVPPASSPEATTDNTPEVSGVQEDEQSAIIDTRTDRKAEASREFTRALNLSTQITELETQLETLKTERSQALGIVHELRGAGPHRRDGRDYTIIKRPARGSGVMGYFFRCPGDDVADI